MPKIAGYADDINAMIKNEVLGVQQLFKEYERLTRVSRLELNADKTEIMRAKATNSNEIAFRIRYNRKIYEVKNTTSGKINGIFFQMNDDEARSLNVRKAIERMESKFQAWSMRSLSILGKILIAKTFGISQLTFLMQLIVLTKRDIKLCNAMYSSVIYLVLKSLRFSARPVGSLQVSLSGF